ncbi:hypothetical protein MSG28_000607 [Choristoneura fumiferana]|uniref:Uncharacterized protein n=1 Tax=Choristoneura fumiferana TaxID=7141 RepID=A0ACC0K1N1_CHOFU|nr:hypothetical protein MSG28_000607 [Choristoneura fumiferana]
MAEMNIMSNNSDTEPDVQEIYEIRDVKLMLHNPLITTKQKNVFRGAKDSLLKEFESECYFGVDGLGDSGEEITNMVPAHEKNAVSALIELSKTHAGDNFPTPEFNAQFDIDAYHIVLQNSNPDKVTLLPFSQVQLHLNYSKDSPSELMKEYRKLADEITDPLDKMIMSVFKKAKKFLTVPRADLWEKYCSLVSKAGSNFPVIKDALVGASKASVDALYWAAHTTHCISVRCLNKCIKGCDRHFKHSLLTSPNLGSSSPTTLNA